MKTWNIFYALSVIFLLAIGSCKKDDPIDVSAASQPVFTFIGNLNGVPVNLNAGVNNYYMYASYLQDLNNVYNFTGDLQSYNCTSCTNKLKIIVNDYQSLPIGAAANISTAVSPNYYAYQIPGGTATQYNVNFTGLSYNVSPTSWAWDFGDGTTSALQSPTHTYMHPGNYSVCLVVTFSDLTTSSICNPILLGTPESGCYGNFTYLATINSLAFTGSPSGVPPYTYFWDFGDGTNSTLPTPTHNYASAGMYLASMQVTDATGDILIYNRNVFTQGYVGSVGEFYFFGITANPNPIILSNVTVEWTDASGTIFTSNNSLQPSTSYFKILSVDPHNPNELGQATQKVHAQLKCTLYNGASTILLDNGDVVFGVAYQ